MPSWIEFHDSELISASERRVGIALDAQRQIGAAHRLGIRDIRAHQFGAADGDARVQDRVLPVERASLESTADDPLICAHPGSTANERICRPIYEYTGYPSS
jgi:hypothetical protein